eukprot:scaffold51088_cov60-Phaeocystis_antarctica.AAC.3
MCRNNEGGPPTNVPTDDATRVSQKPKAAPSVHFLQGANQLLGQCCAAAVVGKRDLERAGVRLWQPLVSLVRWRAVSVFTDEGHLLPEAIDRQGAARGRPAQQLPALLLVKPRAHHLAQEAGDHGPRCTVASRSKVEAVEQGGGQCGARGECSYAQRSAEAGVCGGTHHQQQLVAWYRCLCGTVGCSCAAANASRGFRRLVQM